MLPRTWIGGGDNQASDPLDWEPTGAPRPGDPLAVTSDSGTIMNVTDNALAGDLIAIENAPSFTAYLSQRAVMNVYPLFGATCTFNVAQKSTLHLGGISDGNSLTVNIADNDFADFKTIGFGDSNIVVNLTQGATWSGTFTGGALTTFIVPPSKDSAFSNDGSSLTHHRTSIGVDVIGKGTFDVAERALLIFLQSVSPGQVVSDSGIVAIDKPNLFAGSVTLAAQAGQPAEIDLNGLARADSYTFKNDMLNIYAGNRIIDTLRLHDSTTDGFVVENTGSSLNIVAIADPTNPPVGLPIHVGS